MKTACVCYNINFTLNSIYQILKAQILFDIILILAYQKVNVFISGGMW